MGPGRGFDPPYLPLTAIFGRDGMSGIAMLTGRRFLSRQVCQIGSDENRLNISIL